MNTGNQNRVLTQNYPDESLQGMLGQSWWTESQINDVNKYCRGRLVYALIPFVDQNPSIIVSERSEPTNHSEVTIKEQQFDIRNKARKKLLPVAIFPGSDKNEERVVFKAKRRPAIILCDGTSKLNDQIMQNSPAWQKQRCVIVAPYFGATQDGTRGGFSPAFLERIKACEYKQFMWDRLPNAKIDSVLRFDQLQPIGRSDKSLDLKPYVLSPEALELIDEWLAWIFSGELDENTGFGEIRNFLMSII